MSKERAVEGWRELFEAVQQADPQPVRPPVSTSALRLLPPGQYGTTRLLAPSLTRVRSARSYRPGGTWTRQMNSFLPGHTKEASAVPEAFQRNMQFSIQESLQAADEAHAMGYPVVALICKLMTFTTGKETSSPLVLVSPLQMQVLHAHESHVRLSSLQRKLNGIFLK